MNQKRIAYSIILAFSTIHILTIIGFVIKKNYNFLIEALIIYTIWGAITYLQRKKDIYIENYLLALFALTIIGHNLIGQYLNLYNTSDYYDKLLHFLGTFSFTLYIYSIISRSLNLSFSSRTYVFIFLVTLGISLGVLIEIIEFSVDALFHSYNQKGLLDTNLDLISNIFGAILAGIYKTKFKLKS